MLRIVAFLLLVFINLYAGEFQINQEINLLFFGAFSMILVYNLAYLVILKTVTYASYFMFYSSLFVIMLFYTGLVSTPWFEFNLFNIPVGIFFLSALIFLGFTREFLDLKTFYPRIEKLFNQLMIVNAILVMLSAYPNTNAFLISFSIIILLLEILSLILLAVHHSIVNKYIYARFYLLSFSILLFTLFIASLSYFDLYTLYEGTIYLYQVGILFAAAGFSFAIEYKQKELDIQLKQKELLFQELSHRVQNSLQQIISILSMQIDSTSNEKVIESLENTINRISSISLIHKTLQNASSHDEITLNTYLQSLIKGYKLLYNDIKIEIECDNTFQLNLKKLTPLGLIINELIINSVKHAFNNINEKIISIKITEDKLINFDYYDNGNGFEPKDINPSIGSKLITILAKSELKGDLQIDSYKAYHLSLKFSK